MRAWNPSLRQICSGAFCCSLCVFVWWLHRANEAVDCSDSASSSLESSLKSNGLSDLFSLWYAPGHVGWHCDEIPRTGDAQPILIRMCEFVITLRAWTALSRRRLGYLARLAKSSCPTVLKLFQGPSVANTHLTNKAEKQLVTCCPKPNFTHELHVQRLLSQSSHCHHDEEQECLRSAPQNAVP